MRGCEIWLKIGGTPPADASEMTLIGLHTHYRFLKQFTGTEGGKVAHYMFRWINTRGQPGPWSETVSVSIAA